MCKIVGYATFIHMKIFRNMRAGSGFSVRREPGDRIPLEEAGEIWAHRSWSILEHTNPGWELYIQNAGRSRWEIGGKEQEVPELGAYLIRAGVPHRLLGFPEQTNHFHYLVFREEALSPEIKTHPGWQRDAVIFQNAMPLTLPVRGLFEELALPGRWQEEACRGYLSTLCVAILRLLEAPSKNPPPLLHPASERAMKLLRDRPGYPWNLEELARLSGLSRPHLIEVFRRDHGETPMRTLMGIRLEEGRRQLRTASRSVTEIAFDMGFSSSQHFARAFRDRYGCTPRSVLKK